MAGQSVVSKLKRSFGLDGPSYERLEAGYNKEDDTGKKQRSSRSWQQLKPVVIASALLLTIYFFLASGRKPVSTTGGSSESTLPSAYLRLIVPVTKPDVNLCKTLLSGAVLNYPEPILAGWSGKSSNEDDLPGQHVSSLASIDKYLHNLTASRDDDLVIIANGDNTWFQLRPQTLLDRYFETNRRADGRIRQEIGTAADSLKIRQRILFASQKDCSPWSAEAPACYAAPPSTLPRNVYGPETDADVADAKDPFAKHRPRYLSSDFAIGPLGAMRALYTEAAVRAKGDPNLKKPEHVLGQIFGEQEIARVSYRKQSLSRFQRFVAWASSFWQSQSYIAAKQKQEVKETDLSREFGIGLDYEGGLALEGAHSANDVEYVKFGSASQLPAARAARGISDGRNTDLQADIATSLPPFWTFSPEKLPRNKTWNDVSLLTNVYTGVTPAIIQSDKAHLEKWWGDIWFRRFARKLFDVHIQAPLGAVAYSGPTPETRRQWWSPEDWKGGARNTTRYWVRYEDICTDTEKEVFRDGKGPWYLPSNH